MKLKMKVNLYKCLLPAYNYGGVGEFSFNKESQLNETSILINDRNRKKLFKEWSKYWDTDKEIFT